MGQTVSFDYFYGGQSDTFSYYRIPRLLITGHQFKRLSTDAKLLYGLLLDRMGLSSRNGWYDELGRVYIYYALDEIKRDLNCGHDKAVKLLAELDTGKGIGLIERVKQGQGRPAKIYVKQFTTTEIPQPQEEPDPLKEPNPRLLKSGSQDFGLSEVLTSEKQTSRLPKTRSADFGKSEGNYNNIIYPDKSYIDPSIYPSTSGAIRQMDRRECREEVKENIEYQELAKRYGHEDVDEILDLLTDTICSTRPTIRMGGEEILAESFCFFAEKKPASVTEYCLIVRTGRFGRGQPEIGGIRMASKEIIQAVVNSQIQLIPIIQSCAFDGFFGNVESERADQMQCAARYGAGAGNIAGVGRDFRFNQNNVNHSVFLLW